MLCVKLVNVVDYKKPFFLRGRIKNVYVVLLSMVLKNLGDRKYDSPLVISSALPLRFL